MHEVSLAEGILELVEAAAQRESFQRVSRLHLEVGALAGVDVEALRFALACAGAGTRIAGATLQIDQPPATAWCLACSQSVVVSQRTDPCPACGAHQLHPTGGTELRVVDLVVHDV